MKRKTICNITILTCYKLNNKFQAVLLENYKNKNTYSEFQANYNAINSKILRKKKWKKKNKQNLKIKKIFHSIV